MAFHRQGPQGLEQADSVDHAAGAADADDEPFGWAFGTAHNLRISAIFCGYRCIGRESGLLNDKHASLERAIEEENLRPHPDDIRISQLKREKLRIKDEIFQHGG
jgi:hypothetical protein